MSTQRRASGLLALVCAILSLGAAEADQRLVVATRNQDFQTARTLINQGVDVNARQTDGATALHWAAHWADVETVEALIRGGANVNATNELGATPLWAASVRANAPTVERLLKGGADPNVSLPTGEAPLMTAARAGIVDTVKLLLSYGAEVNARERLRDQTALMWAASQNHPDVAGVLIAHGADVHARSRVRPRLQYLPPVGIRQPLTQSPNPSHLAVESQGGFTPLLFAARNGHVESARVLLTGGAKIDDPAPTGASPLVIAALSGEEAMALFLVEQGANPNADGAGYTALHAALLRGETRLTTVLLAHGASPNAVLTRATPARRLSDDFSFSPGWIGATPYWLAVRFGEVDAMRQLAALGVDTRFTAKDGTPTMIAAIGLGATGSADTGALAIDRRGNNNLKARFDDEPLAFETVKLAIEQGADVNAVDGAGNTALHGAVQRRFASVITFLAESGGAVNVKNKAGQTPLMIAAAQERNVRANPKDRALSKTLADLLRRLGAVDQ